MALYARVDNPSEIVDIPTMPPHKAHLWKPVTYEGAFGSATSIIVENDAVRVVRSVTPLDVKAEAQRRIVALTGAPDLNICLVKQLNASMRATELVNKKVAGTPLSQAEEAEASALQALADGIKAIRARSNAIEAMNPIPSNYVADSWWA